MKINAAYENGGERARGHDGQGAARPSAAATSRSTTWSPSTSAASGARSTTSAASTPTSTATTSTTTRRPGRLRGDRHRPRLPEALRQGRAGLRPLPPRRQRPRPRRAPAGLPAPGAHREGHEGADQRRHRARQPQEARAGLRPLLRPRQVAGLHEGDLQVRQDRPVHGGQPGARGPLPRRRRARTTSTSWRREDMLAGDRRRVPEREGVGGRRAETTEPTDADVARVRGAGEAAPRQAVDDPRPRGGARGGREPGDPRLRARSTSRSTSRRCARPAPPTRARSRARTRSATSAARSTTRTGSCSPRASSASTTASRARPGATRRSSTTRTTTIVAQRPQADGLPRRQAGAARRLADARRPSTGSRTRSRSRSRAQQMIGIAALAAAARRLATLTRLP